MDTRNTKKRGYSLVEAVFYIAILSLFFILIINAIISFTRPYRDIVALRFAETSGLDSMERITREIRAATSVDTGNSTLGSSPGVLTLISTYGGVSTTTKFYLDGGVLKLDVNGSYLGPLSSSKTSVTNLVFRKADNSRSSLIKVELTVSATVGTATKTKKYYSSTILKAI